MRNNDVIIQTTSGGKVVQGLSSCHQWNPDCDNNIPQQDSMKYKTYNVQHNTYSLKST
jgi:hypothetical protein